MSRRTSRLRAALPAGLAAAAALLAAAQHSLAVEPNVYINRGEWFAHSSGDGATGDSGSSGDFDFDETLDLNLDKEVASFDSFIRSGKSRFMFSWNQVRYSGENRLDDDLVFEGDTYPAGDKLRSAMHYDRWRLLYARPIVDGKEMAAGFLAGIEDYRVEHDVDMSGQPSNTAKIDSRVPILGGSFTWLPIPFLRVYGELTGMSLKRGDTRSKLLNALVRVEYDLYAELLAISLDYRTAYMDAEEEDEAQYDIQQRGVGVGLTLKF
jgi:hypothetical protein